MSYCRISDDGLTGYCNDVLVFLLYLLFMLPEERPYISLLIFVYCCCCMLKHGFPKALYGVDNWALEDTKLLLCTYVGK